MTVKTLVKKLHLYRLYNPLYFPIRLLFLKHGGLKEEGWFKSVLFRNSINGNGDSVPWYNYSAIHFINSRLKKTFRVFEYGAGNSTLWLSDKVKEVFSVEHSEEWVELLKKRQLPQNVTIIKKTDSTDYANEIKFHGNFDIVIIDGRWRDQCFTVCSEAIKPETVIIWDNSDREEYTEKKPMLKKLGFKELVFKGVAPATYLFTTTSILYKKENCFGI